MRKYAAFVFILLCDIGITGCGPKKITNLAAVKSDIYTKEVKNSQAFNRLNEYLSKENIKLRFMRSIENNKLGPLANLRIGDQYYNFAFKEASEVFRDAPDRIIEAALSSKYSVDSEYLLSYCVDLMTATPNSQASSIEYEVKYRLSKARKSIIDSQIGKVAGCDDDYSYGQIIYLNKIKVYSSFTGSKSTPEPTESNKPLTGFDQLWVAIVDAGAQAGQKILTDTKMLEAFDDFRKSGEPSTLTTAPTRAAPADTSTPVEDKLAPAKRKCLSLGFKEGTKDYGNCVLQLAE